MLHCREMINNHSPGNARDFGSFITFKNQKDKFCKIAPWKRACDDFEENVA